MGVPASLDRLAGMPKVDEPEVERASGMRTIFKAMAAAVLLAPAMMIPASAQTDALSKASTDFYNSCVAKEGASAAECACVTGFFGGMMEEDEFRIMTSLMPFIDLTGEVADMNGAIAAAQAVQASMGMSDARFTEIMENFVELDTRGKYGDRICMPLASK